MKLSFSEISQIVGLIVGRLIPHASKLVPDVMSLLDGVAPDEVAKLVTDAEAVLEDAKVVVAAIKAAAQS